MNHELIKFLVKQNIPVSLEWDKVREDYVYVVDGFYYSGCIRLRPEGNESFTVISSDGEEREVISPLDLAQVNVSWYFMSRQENPELQPSPYWLDVLIGFDLIKVQDRIVKEYIIL